MRWNLPPWERIDDATLKRFISKHLDDRSRQLFPLFVASVQKLLCGLGPACRYGVTYEKGCQEGEPRILRSEVPLRVSVDYVDMVRYGVKI